MFDINEIKQRINCVDVAKMLGLAIQRSGDRCVSPLRPGAHNPSSFTVSDDFWYDFGDAKGGDCIDLLAEIKYNGNKGQAIRELAHITGVHDDKPVNQSWVEYTDNLNNKIAYWHEQLTDADYEYLYKRGLTDATIKSLRIGRTDEGRLSIPYFKNGYVAYYCTRYLPGGKYPEAKYRKQKLDDFCEHTVWGLDTLSRSGSTLVIAEGAFDVISFYQENYPCISAITGHFSKHQLPTVIAAARSFDNVFMVYDNDDTSHAGERFTERMAAILIKNRIPFIVGTVPRPYKDVSDYYADGGDLAKLVENAEDGLFYLAKTYDYPALEKFIYKIARHTKRSRLDDLFSELLKLDRWSDRKLHQLHKSCTTAPPEKIVADEISKKHKLVYLTAIGFYEYVNGVWVTRSDDDIKLYIDRALGEFTTNQRINAVYGLLRIKNLANVQFDKKPVWNFINGTLELDTGVFRDHSPNDYCSLKSDYPYNQEATCPVWEQFIDDVTNGDPKAAEILQFIPAYVLFPDCIHEKVFVLTGSGGNGKSQYIKMLSQLFGESKTTHLQPRDMLDKFQRIKLKDAILNLAGEIKSDLKDAEEAIKMIASGEPISGCHKGEPFVDFITRAKLVFACNGQLASGDTSDGLTRRLIIVDFKMKFVDYPDKTDPYQRKKNIHIFDSLVKELYSGGVFNWVYAGYKMLKTVGYFTETDDQKELLHEFKQASNPILIFYEDEFLPRDISRIDYLALYQMYCDWAENNYFKIVNSRVFHREFLNLCRLTYRKVEESKRVNGQPRKVRSLLRKYQPEENPS